MGPLSGIRVLEFAGIGPGPFAGMMLSDMGAEVLRIDRAPSSDPRPLDLLARGRRSVALDLKHPGAIDAALRLVERCDALIEGFRPGVMERLGLGPETCLGRNGQLVYGRITGWGQSGPFAQLAGHDINYLALAGALDPLGRAGQPPTPPINLLGDFGGGGMLLAFGILCGLVERQASGKGQVIDAAMLDGAAVLMTLIHGFRQQGSWRDERGTNFIDTGAHFYEVFETSDGRFMSVGAIEPQFYAQFLERMGLAGEDLPAQLDQAGWPAMKRRLATIFSRRSQAEWNEIFSASDACVAPVLSMSEAPHHPHLAEREVFVKVAGMVQPAPAPRFSRTPGSIQGPPPEPGQHTDEALRAWGFGGEEVSKLRAIGAIR